MAGTQSEKNKEATLLRERTAIQFFNVGNWWREWNDHSLRNTAFAAFAGAEGAHMLGGSAVTGGAAGLAAAAAISSVASVMAPSESAKPSDTISQEQTAESSGQEPETPKEPGSSVGSSFSSSCLRQRKIIREERA